MSTKKKTTTKKTAKKTTAFDEALQLPAAKTVVAIEPTKETIDGKYTQSGSHYAPVLPEAEYSEFPDEGGEPWPNYSPFPEEENTGPGFSPTNIQPATADTDAVETEWQNVESDEQAIALGIKAQDEPVLGSGSPVDASDPLSSTNMPSDAAKTVEDLIDGLNYLWKLAVTIRGPRGPKQHDESILKKRVAAGRQLLASLK